ncbi:hypothetical protein PC129_g24261 [Phytophthora cactorum]|uniref:Uncharacterized protein n=1 Tax=Phytophthora cactorum TaxID=29920 RepID=A0A329RGS7_9STRA|nr:hypothetical protein Pcac1_g19932 [Phytophthora cactorum]KAG2785910.1 hypothetical protein PC111_g24347 [Phytophthora cactorum]KAG2791413.1 hypothetical protein PC112_g24250 [Phytophthora cactorum]KAG2804646.1 hypothetical protein PC113_g24296 [Phytophthora cactorum]KAG2870594.1 hypothetical protein PC114_g27312 [Phytophthora cactorum]
MSAAGKLSRQVCVRVTNAHASLVPLVLMPPPKKRRHGSTPLASSGMIARIVTGIRPGRDDCARSSSTRCTWRGGVATTGVVLAGYRTSALKLVDGWASTMMESHWDGFYYSTSSDAK